MPLDDPRLGSAMMEPMGLDFTNIKDKPGSAVFIIHDGHVQTEANMRRLSEELTKHTDNQIVVLSIKDESARQIIDFYDLKGMNLVLIVGDDDQLHEVWADHEIPAADVIGYTVERMG